MTTLHKAAREALIAWWEEHRPMGWTAEQHRAQPTVNAQSETDKPLMEIAAATLRAALDEAPGEERDERAAFEDWIAPTLRNGSHLNRSRVNQVYTDNRVAAKWAAWQARAMLAARPSVPQDEPVALTAAECARILATVRYMQGIAERGEGRPMRDDETVEDFVLGYVKRLERVQQEGRAVVRAFEQLGRTKYTPELLTARAQCESAMSGLGNALRA